MTKPKTDEVGILIAYGLFMAFGGLMLSFSLILLWPKIKALFEWITTP
ncbi:hypothetical protein [Spirosoma fluminis]